MPKATKGLSHARNQKQENHMKKILITLCLMGLCTQSDAGKNKRRLKSTITKAPTLSTANQHLSVPSFIDLYRTEQELIAEGQELKQTIQAAVTTELAAIDKQMPKKIIPHPSQIQVLLNHKKITDVLQAKIMLKTIKNFNITTKELHDTVAVLNQTDIEPLIDCDCIQDSIAHLQEKMQKLKTQIAQFQELAYRKKNLGRALTHLLDEFEKNNPFAQCTFIMAAISTREFEFSQAYQATQIKLTEMYACNTPVRQVLEESHTVFGYANRFEEKYREVVRMLQQENFSRISQNRVDSIFTELDILKEYLDDAQVVLFNYNNLLDNVLHPKESPESI